MLTIERTLVDTIDGKAGLVNEHLCFAEEDLVDVETERLVPESRLVVLGLYNRAADLKSAARSRFLLVHQVPTALLHHQRHLLH